MARRFEVDPGARVEIAGHYHRIAERSPERADRWYRGLIAEIATLEKLPLRCPVAPESEDTIRPVRELLYGKRKQGLYRILFEANDDLIRIVAVRHSAQGNDPI